MIRSLFLVTAGVLYTGLTCLIVIFGSPFFSNGENTIHAIAGWWGRTILKLAGIRVEVIGAEHVIKDGAQTLMANHQSWFDIFVVLAYVPCQFRFLAKKELFKVPFFGSALYRYGAIPIDRKNFVSAMRSIDAAAKKIREGKSVMTYPEGTRNKDGRLLPFKKGVFDLALRAGAPIIPISISGTRAIMPKKSLFPCKPGKVTLVVGKPVDVTDVRSKPWTN